MKAGIVHSIVRRAWPGRSIDCLLRAALLDNMDDAAQAWHSFEAGADFDHLSGGEMRLIGMVSRRLPVLAPNSPMRGRVHGIEKMNWSTSRIVIGAAGPGLRALNDAGVAMLIIKGGARAAVGGTGARGRTVNDIDIVVQPEAVEQSFDVLTKIGWLPTGSGTLLFHRSRLDQATGINLVRGRFGNLDLRRTPFHQPYVREDGDQDIWRRSVSGQLAGVALQVPCPTDAISIALAHGALDAHKSSDWIGDIAINIDTGDVDWALLEDIFEQRGLQAPALIALSHVREILARPVPVALLDRLEAHARRQPISLLARSSEIGPKSRMLGLNWAVRAVTKQRRLLRNGDARRPDGRAASVRPVSYLGKGKNSDLGKVLEFRFSPPDRPAGEAWRGSIDVTVGVELPAMWRRVELELNTDRRHLRRLRAMGPKPGSRNRQYRFRLDVSLAPSEREFVLAAAPSRSFNSGAPEAMLARYTALPFTLVALKFS